MVAYTIFQAHVMYVTFNIAFNIQVNVYNKPCLYLVACWAQVYALLLTRFTYFKYSFNTCLELLLLFVLPNDT